MRLQASAQISGSSQSMLSTTTVPKSWSSFRSASSGWDIRIGETAIEEYDEFETEIREGAADDDPVSHYPRQVHEESVGVELIKPLPRDDSGEVIDGPAEEKPIVRTTGDDAKQASVILAWPAGLIRVDKRGRKRAKAVSILIEQRLVTAEDWDVVEPIRVTAKRAEAFFRQFTWSFPTRGRWQVRLTMQTDEADENDEDNQIQQRTTWVALQTIRPEYPLAWPRPLALLALRIKATHQINGSLDNITVMARRVCPDWDHGSATWIARATSNPASLFRHVLQDPANPKAVMDGDIDLDLLQDWHDFCRLQGLTYDRFLEEAGTTLREVLTEIAAAGRATPRHDGLRWGVVIDRPAEVIIDEINPRNSWDFRAVRTYTEQPHALIVRFCDAANDYKVAQRVVVRPGHAGEVTLTELLDLPWVTDADTAWREGYRRFLEAELRPDVYSVTQESAIRSVTRGDTIALSHDVLSATQWAGRVRAVTGPLVEIDTAVTMVDGQTYGMRYRTGLSAEDTIGTSTVRNVATEPGETTILTLTGVGPMPEPGQIVQFGMLATESLRVVVTRVETTADNCSVLTMVDAADDPVSGIDARLAAAPVPPWSSRVGAELAPDATEPAAPVWSSVTSGLSGAGAADTVAFLLAPGSGIAIGRYEVGHRPGTSGTWTTVEVLAANGGGEITDYADGATMQLRARAISSSGTAGPYGPVITVVVAATDLPLPAALDADAISIVTLLGGALVQFGTTADAHTAEVQVYRSTAPTLDRATDAAGEPVAVGPLLSYSAALGDTSREQMLTDAGFDNPGAWTTGAAWTVAGSHATKVASAGAQSISQAQTLVAAKTYRYALTMSGRTAGSLQTLLTGGTGVTGTSYNANGLILGEITADAGGNTAIAWRGTAAFDGTIDTATLYRKTAACLAQGTHYVWLEPRNADGAPGPLAGPFTITIL